MENEKIPSSFSSYAAENSFEPQKKLSFVKVIVIVLIVAFLGVGISLAARIWDPSWNPFGLSPEEVVDRMISKTAALKTFKTEGNMELQTKEGATAFNLSVDFESDIDLSDVENQKSSTSLMGIFEMEGSQFTLETEIVNYGKALYFKLKTVPAILQIPLMMFGVDLDKIKESWIKIDSESLQELTGAPLDLEAVEEIEKDQINLEKLLVGRNAYTVKKVFQDETIRGTRVYHYLAELNPEELKRIILDVSASLSDQEPTEQEYQEALQNLDTLFEKLPDLVAEIWIGKRDFNLYKFKFEQEALMEEGNVNIKIQLDFFDFNKKILIQEPKEYKNIKDVFIAPGSFFPALPVDQQDPSLQELTPQFPASILDTLRR